MDIGKLVKSAAPTALSDYQKYKALKNTWNQVKHIYVHLPKGCSNWTSLSYIQTWKWKHLADVQRDGTCLLQGVGALRKELFCPWRLLDVRSFRHLSAESIKMLLKILKA